MTAAEMIGTRKTRSHVEAARLLAEYIVNEDKERSALAAALPVPTNPPEGVPDGRAT